MTQRRFPPPWTVEELTACFDQGDQGLMVRASLHWEAENPHCFCSISICFVMRVAFCA
jgi:hypothetical protein